MSGPWPRQPPELGGALGDVALRAALGSGEIVVRPLRHQSVGPNSIDVTLSPHLACYVDEVLDARVDNPVRRWDIADDGFVLLPKTLYLGATAEYTESGPFLPWLDGRSSVGRLGISVHATAGRGDVGFRGHWTLEIMVAQPVRVYAGMPIGQITYFTVAGEVKTSYAQKAGAGYADQGPHPVPSKLWQKF